MDRQPEDGNSKTGDMLATHVATFAFRRRDFTKKFDCISGKILMKSIFLCNLKKNC